MAGRRQKRAGRHPRQPVRWLTVLLGSVFVALAAGGGRWWWGQAQSREELLAQLVAAVGADVAKQVETDGQYGFLSLDMVQQRPGKERVIWATLPPDRGWVAVLSQDSQAPGGWLRLGRSPELAHITRVQPVQPVPDPAPELLVETEYDARVGALSYTRQAHLYKWNEATASFAEVWQAILWQEAYSPEPPFARKLTIETRCQLLPNQVVARSTRREYRREGEAATVYRLMWESTQTQKYRWQPQRFQFELEPSPRPAPASGPVVD